MGNETDEDKSHRVVKLLFLRVVGEVKIMERRHLNTFSMRVRVLYTVGKLSASDWLPSGSPSQSDPGKYTQLQHSYQKSLRRNCRNYNIENICRNEDPS